MKGVTLYIALSLDGYIADCNGSVDWIKGHDESVEPADTFTPFFASVDTVIMGKRTLRPDNNGTITGTMAIYRRYDFCHYT